MSNTPSLETDRLASARSSWSARSSSHSTSVASCTFMQKSSCSRVKRERGFLPAGLRLEVELALAEVELALAEVELALAELALAELALPGRGMRGWSVGLRRGFSRSRKRERNQRGSSGSSGSRANRSRNRSGACFWTSWSIDGFERESFLRNGTMSSGFRTAGFRNSSTEVTRLSVWGSASMRWIGVCVAYCSGPIADMSEASRTRPVGSDSSRRFTKS